MMQTHVKIISVLDIILGALTAIGGVFLLFAGPALIASLQGISVTAAAGTTAAGVILGLFVIAVGILGIVVGSKLNEYRNWARVTQIIYGVLQLVNFPLGTAFGIYSLVIMLSEDGKALFAQKPEERIRRAA